MKIIKTTKGIHKIKISQSEWEGIGINSGWLNEDQQNNDLSNELGTEELMEAWEQSEEDIKINKDGDAFYDGKLICSSDENGNPDYMKIRQWMDDNKYWPNVWFINDHGNVSLFAIDEKGQEHYQGGLV